MTSVGLRRRRGGVEFGLIAIACTLIAAAVFGSGFAQSALEMPDQLTWLPNKDGHVTRVNPDSGRPVDRLKVAQPGDELRVVQGNGILTVTNLRTSEVTIVDLSILSFSGTRRGNPGVEVLLDDGRIYLADKATGQLERLDPLTAATVGEPLRLNTPLADAALDNARAFWLLDQTGRLIETQWSDTASRFAERSRRTVRGGKQAVLVAHDRGVTVLDPSSDTVTQIDTGNDKDVSPTPLEGPLLAADSSPSRLVPASATEASKIVVVHEGAVSIVDSSRQGCPRPGKPVVYRGLVHVPCLGSRRVIVLDQAGQPAAQPIATPAGGDPELFLNAGLLIINVQGADFGKVIKPDGSIHDIRTRDPQLEARDPSERPTAVPSSLKTTSPRPSAPNLPGPSAKPTVTGTPRPTGSPTRTAGTPTPTTTTGTPVVVPTTTRPPRPADLTPTGVTAQARADSTILVSWTPPAVPPVSYRILRADTGEQLAAGGGAATSAIITGLPLGMPMAFIVEAVARDGGGYRSAPSNVISAYGRPGAPAISPVEIVERMPGRLTLRVTITPTSDGGIPLTAYDVAVSDGGGRTRGQAQGIPIGQRPHTFTVDCMGTGDLCLAGGGITVTATVHNAAGGGPTATANGAIPAQAAFAYNDIVMIVSSGLNCMSYDFALHACNGTNGQLWRVNATGEIRTDVDGRCIALIGGSRGALRYSTTDCTRRDRRWDHLGVSGNERTLRNQEHGTCLAALGDPAGDGVPIQVRNCAYDANERWTFFKPDQTAIVPVAGVMSDVEPSTVGPSSVGPSSVGPSSVGPVEADTSTQDGALSGSLPVMLLVPLTAALARLRRRRWEARRE